MGYSGLVGETAGFTKPMDGCQTAFYGLGNTITRRLIQIKITLDPGQSKLHNNILKLFLFRCGCE